MNIELCIEQISVLFDTNVFNGFSYGGGFVETNMCLYDRPTNEEYHPGRKAGQWGRLMKWVLTDLFQEKASVAAI